MVGVVLGAEGRTAMNLSGTSFEECGLDKKRTVILLRSVVAISLSYLVVFAQTDVAPATIVYVLAWILSNGALTRFPPAAFRQPLFSKVLFLGDTAAVLFGLYCTVGFSQDFLIVYFFTMFLTAAVETVAQIAVGAIIVSGLYGVWLCTSATHTLGSAEWLRLPFFFIVAIFYAYMTEEVKRERERRLQVEREGQHLRFLLQLSDAFSGPNATRELITQLGAVVTSAFPRLRCTVSAEADGSDANCFRIQAHGATFGALQVTATDGGALRDDEEQFCRVVALVAANALHAAEQTSSAMGSHARLKEEFLGTLSHELRTPLHAILGYIEILENILVPSRDPLAHESVERLRTNTCRLQGLLEEMLWFAELRSGEREVQIEPVHLQEIFEPLVVRTRNELVGRPIHLVSRVEVDIPVLRTDRRKLSHIIDALLSNAAKFTERGTIELTARCLPGEEVEIAVRDAGIGIDAKDFGAIFEDFRQLDGSLTRRVGGMGIGLALAQELATVLGGRIDVESQRNSGSKFSLHLPMDAAKGGGVRDALTPRASAPADRPGALAAVA